MNIILILTLLLINLTGKSQDSCKITIGKFYNLNSEMLNEWGVDSTGCKQLRTKYTLELEKNVLLIGMPKSIFIYLFGQPNVSNDLLFSYLLYAECDEKSNPIKNSTDMSMVVTFNKDEKLETLSIIIRD